MTDLLESESFESGMLAAVPTVTGIDSVSVVDPTSPLDDDGDDDDNISAATTSIIVTIFVLTLVVNGGWFVYKHRKELARKKQHVVDHSIQAPKVFSEIPFPEDQKLLRGGFFGIRNPPQGRREEREEPVVELDEVYGDEEQPAPLFPRTATREEFRKRLRLAQETANLSPSETEVSGHTATAAGAAEQRPTSLPTSPLSPAHDAAMSAKAKAEEVLQRYAAISAESSSLPQEEAEEAANKRVAAATEPPPELPVTTSSPEAQQRKTANEAVVAPTPVPPEPAVSVSMALTSSPEAEEEKTTNEGVVAADKLPPEPDISVALTSSPKPEEKGAANERAAAAKMLRVIWPPPPATEITGKASKAKAEVSTEVTDEFQRGDSSSSLAEEQSSERPVALRANNVKKLIDLYQNGASKRSESPGLPSAPVTTPVSEAAAAAAAAAKKLPATPPPLPPPRPTATLQTTSPAHDAALSARARAQEILERYGAAPVKFSTAPRSEAEVPHQAAAEAPQAMLKLTAPSATPPPAPPSPSSAAAIAEAKSSVSVPESESESKSQLGGPYPAENALEDAGISQEEWAELYERL